MEFSWISNYLRIYWDYFSRFLGYIFLFLITVSWQIFVHYFSFIGWKHFRKVKEDDSKIVLAKEQTLEFIELLKKQVFGVFWGSAGKGKTALLAFIANLSPLEFSGNKYVSFPSSSLYAEPFNINALDLFSEFKMLPKGSTFLIDEFKQVEDFSNPNNADFKKRMEGFAAYLTVLRHRDQKLFLASQRLGGDVWNLIRETAGLFIHCKGHEIVDGEFLLSFDTADNEKMENAKSWTILLSKNDLNSYDSKWMAPILDTKNTALEFAKNVGSKHLVEYVRRLEDISKSNNEGIDPNVLSAITSKYERELKEIVSLYKSRLKDSSSKKT
jgi:hypothetical protein